MRSASAVLTLALLAFAGAARAQVTTTTSTTATTETSVADTTSTSTTTSSTTSTLCTPPEIANPAECLVGRSIRKECRQCCKQQVYKPTRQACECREHPTRDLNCPEECRATHNACVDVDYEGCVAACEDKAPGGCNAIANCVRKCQRQRDGNRFVCDDLLDDCYAACPRPHQACVREGKQARAACFAGCEALPKKAPSERQVAPQAETPPDEADCADLSRRCRAQALSQCRLNCLDEDACFGIPEAIQLCQSLCAERPGVQPALGACGNRANRCCIEAGCPTTTTTTSTTTTSLSTTTTSTTVVTSTTTTTIIF